MHVALGYCLKYPRNTKALIDSVLDKWKYNTKITQIRFKTKKASKKRTKSSTKPRLSIKNENVSVVPTPVYELSKALPCDEGWYLPAGTKVKHGTSTNNIRSILMNGIVPGIGRAKGRDIEPPPLTKNAVYVGSCHKAYSFALNNFMASFGDFYDAVRAIPNYTNNDDEIINSLKRSDLPIFLSTLKKRIDKKYLETGIEIRAACCLPLVLNITLQEDCFIVADEDYISGDRHEKSKDCVEMAGQVWDVCGSASIVTECIPPSWIDSIEHPNFNHRHPEYVYEKELLYSDYDLRNELVAKELTKKIFFRHKYQDRKNYESKILFERDLRCAIYANSIARATIKQIRLFGIETLQSPRELWMNEWVKKYGTYVFSGHEVPTNFLHVLDKLEDNDRLEILACGLNLIQKYNYLKESEKTEIS